MVNIVVDMLVDISVDGWLIHVVVWWSIDILADNQLIYFGQALSDILIKKRRYSTDMSPTLYRHFTATLPSVSPLSVNNWSKVCWYMSILQSYFAASQATLQENRITLLEMLMKVLKCLQVLSWFSFSFLFFLLIIQ